MTTTKTEHTLPPIRIRWPAEHLRKSAEVNEQLILAHHSKLKRITAKLVEYLAEQENISFPPELVRVTGGRFFALVLSQWRIRLSDPKLVDLNSDDELVGLDPGREELRPFKPIWVLCDPAGFTVQSNARVRELLAYLALMVQPLDDVLNQPELYSNGE